MSLESAILYTALQVIPGSVHLSNHQNDAHDSISWKGDGMIPWLVPSFEHYWTMWTMWCCHYSPIKPHFINTARYSTTRHTAQQKCIRAHVSLPSRYVGGHSLLETPPVSGARHTCASTFFTLCQMADYNSATQLLSIPLPHHRPIRGL